jgi:cell division topological specificity factor
MKLFDRLFGRGPAPSAQTAKERLQFVLVHDRADIPPAVLDLLKDEIIAVISQHVEINREGVEINLTHTPRESKLVADIPLLTAAGGGRRRRR